MIKADSWKILTDRDREGNRDSSEKILAPHCLDSASQGHSASSPTEMRVSSCAQGCVHTCVNSSSRGALVSRAQNSRASDCGSSLYHNPCAGEAETGGLLRQLKAIQGYKASQGQTSPHRYRDSVRKGNETKQEETKSQAG